MSRRKSGVGPGESIGAIVSPEIRDLLGPPPLLEGEDAGVYSALMGQIRAEVGPKGALEEIWVRDVADLIWETLRLRRLRAKLFHAAAHEGLSRLVGPLTGGLSTGLMVNGWAQRKPDAVKQVDALLKKAGLDHDAIAVQTLVIKIDAFEKIDRMIMQTETRRNIILREIDRHRDVFAGTVVRRSNPLSASIELVCTAAISRPSTDLPAMSRPQESAALTLASI